MVELEGFPTWFRTGSLSPAESGSSGYGGQLDGVTMPERGERLQAEIAAANPHERALPQLGGRRRCPTPVAKPLRWCVRARVRSRWPAPHRPSTSDAIDRSATKPIIWRNRSASEPFSRKLAKRDPINGHLGPIRWWWCRSANPSLRQIDDDRFARTARLAKLAGSRSARWAQRLRDTNE